MKKHRIRKGKRISFFLYKVLPKPIVRIVLWMKGTGLRDSPVMIHPNNPQSLKCTITYNKYGSYCTPDSCKYDGPVQYSYRGKQYEDDTVSYINSQNLNGDIVHAGAYFGDMIPALANANRNIKLWAFEPNTESHRCAQITILLNDLKNVTLTHAALGDSEGVLNLQVVENEDESVRLGGKSRVVNYRNANTQEVKILTLDEFIPKGRKISLIHLDIEGFELEALKGAERIIREFAPVIITEIGHSEVSDYLKKFGYEFQSGLDRKEVVEGYRDAVFSK